MQELQNSTVAIEYSIIRRRQNNSGWETAVKTQLNKSKHLRLATDYMDGPVCHVFLDTWDPNRILQLSI